VSKYKGRNDNATLIGQTHYRAQYKVKAFEDSALSQNGIHESVVDFNLSEKRYYGKIDDENDPVVVKSSSLISLQVAGGQGQDIKLAIPPMDKMFSDFQRKFVQAVRLQKIPDDDPYLASPQAHYAFVDPIREYKVYMSEVLDAFNQEWLTIEKNSRQVVNIEGYIKQFLLYQKMMGSEFPVTLTGWRKSKRSSALSTGMVLSISNLDCAVDSDKEVFLFNKNCVQFYLQACKQFGFSVSRNCPWLLYADLAGAGSSRFLSNAGVLSVRDFFTKNYTKTYTLDVELLRSLVRKSYSDFIKENVFFKRVNICSKDNNKLIYKNIFRNTINKLTYNENYDEYYWIPYYIKIRNIEDEMPYDEPAIVRIIQKASEFEKLLDTSSAMSYINEQFRKKYRYAHGGYLYYAKRAEERRNLSERRDDEDVSNY